MGWRPKEVFVIFVVVTIKLGDLAAVREVELNKFWTLKNQNGSIVRTNVNLPSGVYSAFDAESPDQVLDSYNDVNMRWISYDNWTYSIKLDVDASESVRFINLTFHGIDTIAEIVLNGKTIGHTDNMFVRYSFNIKDIINKTDNELQVIIKSPVYAAKQLAEKYPYTPPECPHERYKGECHMNMLRKMQASFSWDWGLAAPSMGIWKPVVLEFHDVAIIRDVDVMLFKGNGMWKMFIRVFLETGLSQEFYGELTFYAVELLDPYKQNFTVNPNSKPNSVIEFSCEVPEDRVQLWWPNGYGPQKLYHLHFTWKGRLDKSNENPREMSVSQKSIRIGFRTVELIQDKYYNGDSFYFRVNGVPMFMKGTNYIPSHILPERGHNQNRIKHLLESVKQANMNMIRIWGGGIYESDYFYDMADYLGILIWHDMMFACAMYPVFPEFLESVREETIQNVKRIARHPSIAVWATNNENEAALVQNWYQTAHNYSRFANEYRQLYVRTIYKELNALVHNNYTLLTRPEPLMSSPSNGKSSKEDDYISANPQDPNFGDVHFYEYIRDGWNPKTFPRPRFSSEYGFQSLPALSSWNRVMAANDSLEDLMDHRQHFPFGSLPIVALILRHLPLPLKEHPDYTEALVYFSQISQAMATKVETEVYRSQRNSVQNTMGALYWQLNDVWVAPSWSSIDYFGNYKILHYWAKDFFAPISIIAHLDESYPDKRINIYIARDTINADTLEVTINLKIYSWAHIVPKREFQWLATIKSNTVKLARAVRLSDMLRSPLTKNNCFFEFSLTSESDETLAKTYFFPDSIKLAEGMTDPMIDLEISSTQCRDQLNSASIAVKVRAPAVFVYIEILHPNITHYKLSMNGFIQVDPVQTVHVEFNNNNCLELKRQHIKVLTVNQFMK